MKCPCLPVNKVASAGNITSLPVWETLVQASVVAAYSLTVKIFYNLRQVN